MSDADLVVVGAGIAGLTAARVAAEHGLRVLALDRLAPGGQLVNLGEVSGYPGLPASTTGPDLAGTLLTDAMTAGVEFSYTEATALVVDGPSVGVETPDGPVTGRAVVVATGLAPGRLDVPDADAWAGHGVSACATCDGPLFAGQPVAVVGDDDWAAQEAVELAAVAGPVSVLAPGAPGWSPLWARRLDQVGVGVREHAPVVAVTADDADGGMTGVRLADGAEVPARGVFPQTGRLPRTGFAAAALEPDPTGRIPGDPATALAGVFVAGDVRSGSVDRLVAAAADGLRAGRAAVVYIGQA